MSGCMHRHNETDVKEHSIGIINTLPETVFITPSALLHRWGALIAPPLCSYYTSLIESRSYAVGRLLCLGFCSAWASALLGLLLCLGYCSVWASALSVTNKQEESGASALSGLLLCLGFCSAWASALSGLLLCMGFCSFCDKQKRRERGVCSDWAFALPGLRFFLWKRIQTVWHCDRGERSN